MAFLALLAAWAGVATRANASRRSGRTRRLMWVPSTFYASKLRSSSGVDGLQFACDHRGRPALAGAGQGALAGPFVAPQRAQAGGEGIDVAGRIVALLRDGLDQSPGRRRD